MIELLLLRDLERVVGAPEVGARINRPLVEPEPVEVIADVVVVRIALLSNTRVWRIHLRNRDVGRGDAVGNAGERLADAKNLAGIAFDIELLLDVMLASLPMVGLRSDVSTSGERTVTFNFGGSLGITRRPFQNVIDIGTSSSLSRFSTRPSIASVCNIRYSADRYRRIVPYHAHAAPHATAM